MNEPLVSIVILNYNGLKYLKECIDSLNHLSYRNKEIFLIDNNSGDASVQFVEKNYSNVKIIRLIKNYGFSKGYNLGITYCKGEFLVLLNQDTVVDRNWLSELVKVAIKSNKIGIVGSKNYFYDDKTEIFYALGTCDKFGNTQNIGHSKRDNPFLNTQTNCFFVCGAALMIKRELYEKIKLFDPTYFMYFEDVDLCWRAIISGYDVIYAPKSFIYHKVDRIQKNVDRKSFFLERNRLRTILKNLELKSLKKVLPGYLFQIFSKIQRNRLRNKMVFRKLLIIYSKAIIWNIIHVISLIKQRIWIKAIRKKSDKEIFLFMKNLNNYIDLNKTYVK